MYREVHYLSSRDQRVSNKDNVFNVYTGGFSNTYSYSSVLEAVVQPAKALENNICCSSLQKYAVETAYMFLGDIKLVSVTTMRVEGEEEALRHRQSRDLRWDI